MNHKLTMHRILKQTNQEENNNASSKELTSLVCKENTEALFKSIHVKSFTAFYIDSLYPSSLEYISVRQKDQGCASKTLI